MSSYLKSTHLFFLLLTLVLLISNGQAKSTPVQWNAHWIAAPHDPGTEYGVYDFRKDISLAKVPDSFIVHVSADNRYKLFVNGHLVSVGPARGDTYYWNFETIDLAPYLVKGKNAIAAQVWNEAQYRPEAIISVRTGFILQGNTSQEEILNTNESWKCIPDKAYQPLPGFFAASTGEMVDMNKIVQDFAELSTDINSWPAASNTFRGELKGGGYGFGYELTPSPIPARDLVYQRIPSLRKAEGVNVPASFPANRTEVMIPANTVATLLLDQQLLTNAYLTLKFSKGKDAGISIGYAESMFDKDGHKPNRNVVDGKIFDGRKDSLKSNGLPGQSYTTLNFRTFRYIRLVVHTQAEPLTVDDIYGTFTAYPFRQAAQFQSDSAEIQQMIDIGWRTARLNAFETYTDCPYYEQLQYIGDTRIQAMMSYYYSGDDRLARNALTLMDHSRLAEGITLSRYPSWNTQIIPTFSLWYIGMLYDYWMYRGDDGFVRDKLQGTRDILEFFSKYQDTDGSVKNLPYWVFTDWSDGKGWNTGVAPMGDDGCSAITDLQLLWTLQVAAKMEATLGGSGCASLYESRIAKLKNTIQSKYWDPVKGFFADTREKATYSQHANALAILAGMVDSANLPAFGKRLETDTTLTECTIYFKYYLFEALTKAGLGNDFFSWLGVWRDDIRAGLSTWAEFSDPKDTRSDCHAWGCSPDIEFFRTVLGIDSDQPGFRHIRIEPHLGTMTRASGSMPHPTGKVDVSYNLQGKKWSISINLPKNTTGVFIWKGEKHAIAEGANHFSF